MLRLIYLIFLKEHVQSESQWFKASTALALITVTSKGFQNPPSEQFILGLASMAFCSAARRVVERREFFGVESWH